MRHNYATPTLVLQAWPCFKTAGMKHVYTIPPDDAYPFLVSPMREHGFRHAHAGSEERECVLRRSTGPQVRLNPVLGLVAVQPSKAMTLPICQAVRSAIAVCFGGPGAEDTRAQDLCLLDVEIAQFAGHDSLQHCLQ
jgi:hypothetical protein